MGKYLRILKITFEEYFAYRLNFLCWRLRNVLRLLTVYFLWQTLFLGKENIFGYPKTAILTYILFTSFLSAFVLGTRTVDVGREIVEGTLTNFLLKPLSYFKYYLMRDLADKILNLLLAFFEITLIFLIFRPEIFLERNIFTILFFLSACLLGMILYFLVSFLLSLVGFWSPDVWAPRFLFLIFLEFLGGGLFPLDILPKTLYQIIRFLPFNYFFYFPLSIYLGRVNAAGLAEGFILAVFWIVVLSFGLKNLWRKGLLSYDAVGR